MPAYKSFRYKAKTTWASARRGLISAVEKPNIVVGSPPEFKGEPDVWTPEELLVGSLNTCIMLTFLSIAQLRVRVAERVVPRRTWATSRSRLECQQMSSAASAPHARMAVP